MRALSHHVHSSGKATAIVRRAAHKQYEARHVYACAANITHHVPYMHEQCGAHTNSFNISARRRHLASWRKHDHNCMPSRNNNNNNNDSSHFTHCMRSTHLLTISSQAALSEADCTASRSDRLMHCKSFLTTSIHLRRGRPRGRRMSVVLIDIRRAWKEDDSSPSLTTWPNHSSLRCLQTWDSGVCSVLAYSAVFEIRCGYVIPMMVRSFTQSAHINRASNK